MRVMSAITAVMAATIAGCATVTPLAVPEQAPGSQQSVVADRLPTQIEYWGGTPVEGTHFSVGGAQGSVAVGLLFGPVGVAANAARIQSVNEERASQVSAITDGDVADMLRTIRAGAPAGDASATRSYELVPAAQLWFWTPETFSVRCAITASLPTGERRPWRARYFVNLDPSYDVTDAAAVAAAAQSVEPCLMEADRLFEGHVDGALVAGAPRRIRTEGQTGRWPLVDSEAPDRIVVQDTLGLVEFRPSATELLD